MKTKILTLCLTLAAFGLMPSAKAQFTYTTNSGSITITKYTGAGGAVTIPDTINGYPVTSIGEQAFYYCTSLTSVTISNSVTTIGDEAFYLCSSLTSVTIPNSVTNIGSLAFSDCNDLTSVTVIAGNPDYSSTNGILFNQNQTTLIQFPETLGGSYTIPNSVTNIGELAFFDCTGLTSITIGNSVTNIGEQAFYYCTGLTSVTISNSVTTIGDDAFRDCTSLTSVTIPNSVTNIGELAFFDCTSLTSITVIAGNPDYSSTNGILFNQNQTILIQFPETLGGSYTIPNSVTTIGEAAFFNCTSLASVTIGNSVTNIGLDAFYVCTSLTSVTIPSSVTTIGDEAFDQCSSLTNVTVGNSVTTIGEDAFGDCTSLTGVTIGNSVTTIGELAFFDCTSLTSVAIPNSVTNIGDEAFDDCASLTNITFLGNAPVLDDATEFTDDGVAAKVVYYYYGTSGWSSTYGGLPTVELFTPPQISGVGGNVGVPSGNFSFTVTGVSNQTIVVEASTNLVNWQPVWTNTLSGTNANFTDPQWTNFPSRFYRAQ
jgi:hypothetical protein